MTNQVRNEARKIRRESISDGAKCEVCGYSISNVLNLHHKLRVADGGDNSPNNLIWLCPTCHNLTHDRANANVRIEKLYLDISAQECELDDFDSQVIDNYGADGAEQIKELSQTLADGQIASFLALKAKAHAARDAGIGEARAETRHAERDCETQIIELNDFMADNFPYFWNDPANDDMDTADIVIALIRNEVCGEAQL